MEKDIVYTDELPKGMTIEYLGRIFIGTKVTITMQKRRTG